MKKYDLILLPLRGARYLLYDRTMGIDTGPEILNYERCSVARREQDDRMRKHIQLEAK